MSRNESEVLEEVEFIVIMNSENEDQKESRYFSYILMFFIIKYLIIYLIYSL